MSIRKVTCVLIVLSMIFCLAACGKKNDTANNTENPKPAAEAPKEDSAKPEAPKEDAAKPDTTPAEDTANPEASSGETEVAPMIPGKLNFINLKEGEEPILRGVHLAGNIAGSTEFNSKDPAADGIRFIFELNEWVEIYPDTDVQDGFTLFIVKHDEKQNYSKMEEVTDLITGFVQTCDLNKDPDAEENYPWGSFDLNPDDVAPGYYDLIFTYKGKAIATLLTKFYGDGGIRDKSDSELEKIMADEVKAAESAK